jgi:hypothetical protein
MIDPAKDMSYHGKKLSLVHAKLEKKHREYDGILLF